MSRPTLTLIDGSGYLYRAFHALPPLTNRTGEPTGALFGVFNMVRLALKSKPDYVAFVSDAAGPTFRDELFAEYKAHRPPMPDDLRVQIEPMLALVGALGIPILRVDGVEADDVIGTLALQAAASGIDVVVSTGDKDLAQLVGPHITLVNTMTNSTLDVAGVKTKFGVTPEQIIDYLSLVGDSADNIPGVEKCGPKTAAKWLAEYGTLDAVIANAEKIGGKIGENLRAALPQLPLSRQLATIKTDVALDVTPAGLTLRTPDTEKLREFYRRYEFNAALKELDAAAPASSAAVPDFSLSSPVREIAEGEGNQPSALSPQPSPQSTPSPPNPPLEGEGASAKGEYELVLTLAQLEDWLAKLRNADLIAFDTETNSLDPMRAEIIGVSFAVEPERAAYVPLAHEYAGAPAQLDRNAVLAALRPLLEDADKDKVGQHLKYDMNVLSGYGISVRGVRYDSMLESYVLNSSTNRHDMDALAKRYLGVDTIRYEDVTGKGARRFRSPRSTCSARPITPPRTPTSRCACIARSGRSSKPSRNCAACSNRSRCRSCRCSRAWSRPAC
jgi:DNA polymerase-1